MTCRDFISATAKTAKQLTADECRDLLVLKEGRMMMTPALLTSQVSCIPIIIIHSKRRVFPHLPVSLDNTKEQ